MVRLSEFFSLREMTSTQVRGAANDPSPAEIANLRRLCGEVLDPLRRKLGPLHTNSGYRSVAVNAQIGGSKSSAHTVGCAWDGIPLAHGVTLLDLFDAATESVDFDQVIFEYGRWIHIGIRPLDLPYRKQKLMIFSAGRYESFDRAVALAHMNREERSNG